MKKRRRVSPGRWPTSSSMHNLYFGSSAKSRNIPLVATPTVRCSPHPTPPRRPGYTPAPPPQPRRSGFTPTLFAVPTRTRPPIAPYPFTARVGVNPDLRTAIENRALIAPHRVEKSISPGGKVHTACRWSGSTTQASIPNGRSARVTRTASRNCATSRINRSDPRSAKATVKNTVAPSHFGRIYLDMPAGCPQPVKISLPKNTNPSNPNPLRPRPNVGHRSLP